MGNELAMETRETRHVRQTLTSHWFRIDDIGDWQGEEWLAARQLNCLLKMAAQGLGLALSPQMAVDLAWQVWSDWAQDTRVLDLGTADMFAWARGVSAGYACAA